MKITQKNSWPSIVLSLLAAGCASAGIPTKPLLLHNAVVERVSPLPPYTGLVRTWVRLTFEFDDHAGEFLLPYYEAGHVPLPGKHCSLAFHIEDVQGQVGADIGKVERANVIDKLDCW